MMRITVEIDASDLRAIQRITGEKKKSPALSFALREYIRENKKQKIIEKVLSGNSDYSQSNEELEAASYYDTH